MITKLRSAIYQAKDLQIAKEWYMKFTGMKPYFDEPFYVGFNINGFELGLDPNKEMISNAPQAIAYWSVNDIETCIQKSVELGARITEDITQVGGGIKMATVQDPWGNAIGLIEEN